MLRGEECVLQLCCLLFVCVIDDVDDASSVPLQQNFGNIYAENTPQAYVQTLVPIDYGHYHDRYMEMSGEELTKLGKGKKITAIELGSSYGNTTLGYRCGYNWDKAVDAW